MMSVKNYTGEVSGFPTGSTTQTFQQSPFSSVISRFTVGSDFNVSFGSLNASGVYVPSASTNLPSDVDIFGTVPVNASNWVVYGVSATGLNLYLVNQNGTLLGTFNNLVSAANLGGSTGGLGQGALVPSATGTRVVIPYRDALGNHRLARAKVDAAGFSLPGTQSITGFSLANTSTTLSAVAGHSGFFLVGADQTTSTLTRIQGFDNEDQFGRWANFTTNAVSVPVSEANWRMANIVAPEPGTMLALGAGLAVLLRKRRKSA